MMDQISAVSEAYTKANLSGLDAAGLLQRIASCDADMSGVISEREMAEFEAFGQGFIEKQADALLNSCIVQSIVLSMTFPLAVGGLPPPPLAAEEGYAVVIGYYCFFSLAVFNVVHSLLLIVFATQAYYALSTLKHDVLGKFDFLLAMPNFFSWCGSIGLFYTMLSLFALLIAGAFYTDATVGLLALLAVVGTYGYISVIHGVKFACATFSSQAEEVLELLRVGEKSGYL